MKTKFKHIRKLEKLNSIILKYCTCLFFYAGFLFTTVSAQSEYYYYYRDNKQPLDLNTQTFFLTAKEKITPQYLAASNINDAEIEITNTDNLTFLFNTDTALPDYNWAILRFKYCRTEEEYFEDIAAFKNINNMVYAGPCFIVPASKTEVGLSNLFYVKLKQESDLPLLLETALQNDCTIMGQDKYMPLWYTLQYIGKSKSCLDVTNEFHQTKLFEASEPDLMGGAYPAVPIPPQTQEPCIELQGKKIEIYPNPANSTVNITLNIRGNQKRFPVKIYNLMGTPVYTGSIENRQRKEIDITKFAKGIYLIYITSSSKNIVSRFMKQ